MRQGRHVLDFLQSLRGHLMATLGRLTVKVTSTAQGVPACGSAQARCRLGVHPAAPL